MARKTSAIFPPTSYLSSYAMEKARLAFLTPLQNSIHYTGSTGKYSYKMYAIVHENCAHHAPVLKSVGYETIIKGTPIDRNQIKNDFYKRTVESEVCCGSAEFIKMYAYTLTKHPVVVHFDLDKIVLNPMDDLFDAMIYTKDSKMGMAARKRIQMEWPEDNLPEQIDAFFTRDYTSSWPWKKIAGVQGGLLVLRPNETVFHKYMDIILEGNYKSGFNNECGWDGLGYGGWVGAKAFQGLVAYFYGEHSDGAVELDVCKWNQVAADVIWRGPRGKENIGECRKYPRNDDHESNYPRAPGESNVKNNGCDDCRETPIDQLTTIHYTACKKPWSCPTARTNNNDKTQRHRIDVALTNATMCMLLHQEWFKIRREFDELYYSVSKDKKILSRRIGKYNEEFYLGYCETESKYLSMIFPEHDFDISKLYPHMEEGTKYLR